MEEDVSLFNIESDEEDSIIEDENLNEIVEETEDNEVISSGSYSKETLRYVDLVMRLNDEDPSDINLSKYDINKQQKK